MLDSFKNLNTLSKIESVLLLAALLFLFDFLIPDLSVKSDFNDFVSVGNEGGGTNLRQVFWILLFFYIVAITFFQKYILNQVLYGSYFFLITLMVFVSVFWSEFPKTSFTRSVLWLFAGGGVSFLYLRLSLVGKAKDVYLIVSLLVFMFNALSIFIYPESVFLPDGSLKGIHPSKNNLGAIAAVMLLFSLFYAKESVEKKRLFLFGVMFAWLVLLILSASKTSLVLVLVVGSIGFLMGNKAVYIFGLSIVITMFFVIGVFLIASLMVGENILLYYADILSPDLLTGRGLIWSMIFEDISQSIWTGVGYGAYWSTGTVREIFDVKWSFLQVLNSAHNGYIHVLTNFGIIGYLFFMLLTIYKLIRFWRYLMLWELSLIAFILWHSLTETDFLYFKHMWIVFVMLITKAEYFSFMNIEGDISLRDSNVDTI